MLVFRGFLTHVARPRVERPLAQVGARPEPYRLRRQTAEERDAERIRRWDGLAIPELRREFNATAARGDEQATKALACYLAGREKHAEIYDRVLA